MKYLTLLLSLILLFYSETIVLQAAPAQRPCPEYQPINRDLTNIKKEKNLSSKKCVEYMAAVEEIKNKEDYYNICNRIFGITGGKNTQISEFAHMAAIGWKSQTDKWQFLCGGSLISPNYVLTAAHCTKRNIDHATPEMVRMGKTTVTTQNSIDDCNDCSHLNYETPVDRRIKSIIVHPEYHSPKKYYDIALLELDQEVNFTKFVYPACLDRKQNSVKIKLFATGWGETDSRTNSLALQFTTLDVFDMSVCKLFKNRHWNGSIGHELCAGTLDNHANTCYGDSGGPLQYKIVNLDMNININVIVAITSFGSKCSHAVGVYMKISSFIDWIETNVWH